MSDIDLDEETGPMPLSDDGSFVKESDFLRLEGKVDKLVRALNRLILIEERQANHTTRQAQLEASIGATKEALDKLDKKVEKWSNIVIGMWTVAGLVWAAIQFLTSHGIVISNTAK